MESNLAWETAFSLRLRSISTGCFILLRGPNRVEQGLMASISENPFFWIPATMRFLRRMPLVTDSRATKLAPAARTRSHTSKPRSGLPPTDVLVMAPLGVVAEYWPPVMP